MPKKHVGGPQLDKLWLQQQFEGLHREHAVILSKLGDGLITSALEKQILRAVKLTKKIDSKVEDIS